MKAKNILEAGLAIPVAFGAVESRAEQELQIFEQIRELQELAQELGIDINNPGSIKRFMETLNDYYQLGEKVAEWHGSQNKLKLEGYKSGEQSKESGDNLYDEIKNIEKKMDVFRFLLGHNWPEVLKQAEEDSELISKLKKSTSKKNTDSLTENIEQKLNQQAEKSYDSLKNIIKEMLKNLYSNDMTRIVEKHLKNIEDKDNYQDVDFYDLVIQEIIDNFVNSKNEKNKQWGYYYSSDITELAMGIKDANPIRLSKKFYEKTNDKLFKLNLSLILEDEEFKKDLQKIIYKRVIQENKDKKPFHAP